MSDPSITGTATFAARLIRSERLRLGLMTLVLAFVLSIVLVRRCMGGTVMKIDWVFYPMVAVLSFGLVYQGGVWLALKQWTLAGKLPPWQRWASLGVDLGVPGLLMLTTQLHSPRGEYVSLAASVILMFPIVIGLSILRFQPWFTFCTGVCAASIHLALTARAVNVADIDSDRVPVLISYGALIFLAGLSFSAVAMMMRTNVMEAVEEAIEAERAKLAMSVVQHDLRVARGIQASLMPSEPHIGGYDLAGMARPATEAGGDFYDWQTMSDGKLVAAIADVTGHGIGPAMVSAICRSHARANGSVSEGLDSLMQKMNDLICEDEGGARFITMAVAVLGPDGAVELMSAGPVPTLVYRGRTREIESFDGDGFPIGIMAAESYGPPKELMLESGDILVMLTDGFLSQKRKSDNVEFGMNRLIDALKTHAGKPATQIVKLIDDAVREYAEGFPQADDMTAVAIKRS